MPEAMDLQRGVDWRHVSARASRRLMDAVARLPTM
jgi:hypothetical protein